MNRRGTLGAAGAGMIAIALVASAGCAMKKERAAPAPVAAAVAASSRDAAPAGERKERPSAGSLREVHAQLDVELPAAGATHAAVEELARFAGEHGGFVASSAYGRDQAASRAQLRVPPAALVELRRLAASLGPITRVEEASTDVTDAIADLDARLRSARAEEARILTLLDQRTGSIADVLTADRALAEAREKIERLDAESHVAHGRADLATIDVVVTRPFAPALAAEPSLTSKLGEAAKDGARSAGELALGISMVALRAGPSASIFAALGFAVFAMVRRWRARRVVASVP